MQVADHIKYKQYCDYSKNWNYYKSIFIKLLLPMILFSSVGGITWAIRGTDGWDGIQGTILPGLTWGILWYYLSYLRGIDNRSIILWLGLGLALGGELGYAKYISWILGRFAVSEEIPFIKISPWIGYVWLFVCGIGWVSISSILIGWVLNSNKSIVAWSFRIIVPIGFVGIGILMLDNLPSLFFPHYSSEFYTMQNCAKCDEAVYTNSQNFLVMMWWLGAIITAIVQKDKHTTVSGLVLGIGFGISCALTAAWCIGYDISPNYIDWWKVWEIFSGIFLGCLYAIVWYWTSNEFEYKNKFNKVSLTEYNIKNPLQELIEKILLLISVSFLLIMFIHGSSFTIGNILGLYDRTIVGQYDWPFERLWIFIPMSSIITLYALSKIIKYSKEYYSNKTAYFQIPNLNLKISNMILFIGVIGAVTIWPAKIGVLYSILVGFSIWALNKINQYYSVSNNKK